VTLVSVPITNLTFSNGTETFVQATTGNSPLIDAGVYAYSSGSNSYTQATSLQPLQGYWIYAYAATDVEVPYP
jgi:hypothetical protein